MKELQIPKRCLAVEAYGVAGKPVSGSLFAAGFSESAGLTEAVLAILNDEREFLPFLADDSDVESFLAKNALLRVHLRQPDELPADGGSTLELLLADGSGLRGKLMVETHWSESRVVDKLNHASRFVPLVSDDGIDCINIAHVVRAH